MNYSMVHIPEPLHLVAIDTALFNNFSFASLNLANAFGFLPVLESYVKAKRLFEVSPTSDNRISVLELSNRLNQQINLASLEISSVASELDCEEENIKQIADYLRGEEKSKETKLTVAAIGIGAVGAVVSGILATNKEVGNAEHYVGISTGIAEAAFGILILTNDKSIELEHNRNVLKEIWEGAEVSEIFPPSIWYYINYFNPDKPDETSLRYQIIERWMGFKQIEVSTSKKKKSPIDLYFGKGSKYTTEQLYNRANMYDQLESYIKIIKQNLVTLSVEIEKLEL